MAADADVLLQQPTDPADRSSSEDDVEDRSSTRRSPVHESALDTDDDPFLDDYLRRLPKVELHAHLNGCVREATLVELADERGVVLCPKLFPALQNTNKDAAAQSAPSTSANGSRTHTKRSPEDISTPGSGSPRAATFYHRQPRSLADCFEVFVEIARVVDDLVALKRITTEALQDFADQGTAYLELRSTPKRLRRRPRHPRQYDNDNDEDDLSHLEDRASKREYVETILEAMVEFERDQDQLLNASTGSCSRETRHHPPPPRQPPLRHHRPMRCRLLVAIDRSRPVEEAREHVELAISLSCDSPRRVVGIDVGGNPSKGDLRDFFPLLRRARTAGLFVTLHCAEIDCGTDHHNQVVLSAAERTARSEAEAILEREEFIPDRLGHALLLPPRLQERLLELGIPVETCPTSNVMTLELAHHPSDDGSGASYHHVAPTSVQDGLLRHPQLSTWLERDHPVAICTDDPGVFDTTLTREWELVLATNASRLVHHHEDERRLTEDEEPIGSRSRSLLLRRRVATMMARSMDFAFCEAGVKDEIRTWIHEFVDDDDESHTDPPDKETGPVRLLG